MARRVVVAATGTEAGKTHVACALVAELAARTRVLALKPVESGGDADARALSAACEIDTPPLYGLAEPISPHLAAQREGRAIDVARVVAWVEEREHTLASDITVIETAGGLFSPLSPSATNATLVTALEPSVMLLVAPDRLGVLHDVTAALLAFPDRPPTHVVLSAPAIADASTTLNALELAALGIATVVASFPRAALDASATREQARRLAQRVSDFTNASC